MVTIDKIDKMEQNIGSANYGRFDPEIYGVFEEFREITGISINFAEEEEDKATEFTISGELFGTQAVLEVEVCAQLRKMTDGFSSMKRLIIATAEFSDNMILSLSTKSGAIAANAQGTIPEAVHQLFQRLRENVTSCNAQLGNMLAIGGRRKITKFLTLLGKQDHDFIYSHKFDSAEVAEEVCDEVIKRLAQDRWIMANTQMGYAAVRLDELYTQDPNESTITCDWTELPKMCPMTLAFLRNHFASSAKCAYLTYEICTPSGVVYLPLDVTLPYSAKDLTKIIVTVLETAFAYFSEILQDRQEI